MAAAALLWVPSARAQSVEAGYAGEPLPLEQWAQDDWFGSVLDARGAVIGDLKPRLDLGPGTETADTGGANGGGDAGGGAAQGGGAEPTGDEPEIASVPSPAEIDASRPEVARLIRRWIDVAEPPQNATDGAELRYSLRGRKVGRGAGGQGDIESRHETGRFDPVYLWANWRRLDSVDHCTLEEYVVASLRGGSIAECAGRHKPVVRDLVGERADRAQATLRKLDLKPVLKPGPTAETPEAAGTVARQSVAAGEERARGSRVTLWIRAPAVATAEVPDLVGMQAAEAVAALESAGLKPVLKPGPAAARPADSGTIAAQDSEPGASIEAGSEVEIAVYRPPVEQRQVPNVVGMKAAEAVAALKAAGLKPTLKPGPEAAEPADDETVAAQGIEPGSGVAPGSEIVVTVYEPHVDRRTVPDVAGLSLDDARRRMEEAGLTVEVDDLGEAPSREQAGQVRASRPEPGAQLSRGARVVLEAYGASVPTGERYVLVETRQNPAGKSASGRSDDGRFAKQWQYSASGNAVRHAFEMRKTTGENLLKERHYTVRLDNVPREIVTGKPFAVELLGEVSFPLGKPDAASTTAHVWTEGLACVEGCRLMGGAIMILKYRDRNEPQKKALRFKKEDNDRPVRIHLAINKNSEAHIVWIYQRESGAASRETPSTAQQARTGRSYFVGEWALDGAACRGEIDLPEDMTLEEAIGAAPMLAKLEFRADGTYEVTNSVTGETALTGRWNLDGEALSLEQADGEWESARLVARSARQFTLRDANTRMTWHRCR